MRRTPSPATIIASLALFFSLGGTAIAAHHYLITSTGQIRPSVLTKLKGNAGKAGATGAAGSVGKEGPQGKEGSQGKEGNEGTRGPSDVWQAGNGADAGSTVPLSVSVPAGSYLVVANTVASGGAAEVACGVTGGSKKDNAYGQTSATVNQLTLTDVETTVLSSPGKIEVSCGGTPEHFWYATLTATQVGTVH